MDTIRQKIYLAALLHDIGKFYQRASGYMNETNSNLSEQSKGIADYICPKNNHGGPSHQHVAWTNEFFEKFKNIFDNIIENEQKPFFVNKWDKGEEKNDNIANLACNHHLPQSEMQNLICLADWWSSGIDRREKDEEYTDLSGKKIYKNFKNVPLHSVFNILKINDKRESEKTTAYKLKALSLNRVDIFPEIENTGITQEDYYSLLEDFEKEFVKLPTDSFAGFEESLTFLLKKYIWCMPSNTMDMANVSLFEHLKTTAAIADCLFTAKNDDQYKNAFVLNGKYPSIKPNYYPVMLFGADISGIQSFIYDIANKKAAKSLKGRSFYLQLLNDAILSKFKNDTEIQAKTGNILFSSGGKFYLLLPNTEKIKNRINEIRIEIEKELWAEHKGKISVNFSQVAFCFRNEKVGNKYESWYEIENLANQKNQLKDIWKLLSDNISKNKEQKFKNLLIENFDNFFDENSSELKVGGNTKICSVTGEELKEENTKYLEKNNEIPVSEPVKNQTELGENLKYADFIVSFNKATGTNEFLDYRKSSIKILDTNYFLFEENEELKKRERKITSTDYCRIQFINNTNFTGKSFTGHKVSYGYQFYGGNKQALKENGEEKTYQDLAKTEKNEKNENTLLGILRMDIDNLGKLFIEGFDKKEDKEEKTYMSFSAYSTLSFNLDLFFSAYLNVLRNEYIEKDNEGKDKFDEFNYPVFQFKDWLNILYSGGDDLFVVGRWDKTIEFAELVRNEFKKYTQRNEIGISGGIAFVHEKFPISKAAEMAGSAEKKSKNKDGKDAITFFGETVSWQEFNTVKEYKNLFVKLEKKGLSRAVLHTLIRFKQIKDKKINGKQDFRYKWHTAYYLKRYNERYEKKTEITEFINKLNVYLIENSRHYDIIALAARWAEKTIKYSE